MLYRLPKQHKCRLIFVFFGQKCHSFEIKLNRLLLARRGLEKVPVLRESVAFSKGVEWFTEIFFFYGFVACLSLKLLTLEENKRLEAKNHIKLLAKEQREYASLVDSLESEIALIESENQRCLEQYRGLRLRFEDLQRELKTL